MENKIEKIGYMKIGKEYELYREWNDDKDRFDYFRVYDGIEENQDISDLVYLLTHPWDNCIYDFNNGRICSHVYDEVYIIIENEKNTMLNKSLDIVMEMMGNYYDEIWDKEYE